MYRIYADEGLSGTSTRKRVEFNRMVNDARMGKFQLIITKEVSRLSRNILDTIGCTRELRALGVVFGHSLLGYDVKDGQLTIEQEGAEIVRRIFHKYGVEKK